MLLSFDGASYQASEGYVVEFTVRRADITAERPRGISYALVFRPAHGEPFVRFDNAHAPNRTGFKYVKALLLTITGIATNTMSAALHVYDSFAAPQ